MNLDHDPFSHLPSRVRAALSTIDFDFALKIVKHGWAERDLFMSVIRVDEMRQTGDNDGARNELKNIVAAIDAIEHPRAVPQLGGFRRLVAQMLELPPTTTERDLDIALGQALRCVDEPIRQFRRLVHSGGDPGEIGRAFAAVSNILGTPPSASPLAQTSEAFAHPPALVPLRYGQTTAAPQWLTAVTSMVGEMLPKNAQASWSAECEAVRARIVARVDERIARAVEASRGLAAWWGWRLRSYIAGGTLAMDGQPEVVEAITSCKATGLLRNQ